MVPQNLLRRLKEITFSFFRQSKTWTKHHLLMSWIFILLLSRLDFWRCLLITSFKCLILAFPFRPRNSILYFWHNFFSYLKVLLWNRYKTDLGTQKNCFLRKSKGTNIFCLFFRLTLKSVVRCQDNNRLVRDGILHFHYKLMVLFCHKKTSLKMTLLQIFIEVTSRAFPRNWAS